MYVENPTNKPTILYPIGTICTLVDRDNFDYNTLCTIIYIERDEEGYYYYYLLANDVNMNIHYDARFGNYFSFVNSESPYLIILNQPTTE